MGIKQTCYLSDWLMPIINTPETHRKIVSDIVDFKHRIDHARQEGVHIILFSGTYDLIHRGHLETITKGIETYMVQHVGLQQSEILTAVLVDDDELTHMVKPSIPKNDVQHEHPINTPVIIRDNLDNRCYHDPILLGVASLPRVDLTVYAPSPLAVRNIIQKGFGEIDYPRPESLCFIDDQFKNEYAAIVDKVKQGETDFGNYSIESWTLFLYAFLISGSSVNWAPVTRVLSSLDPHTDRIVPLMDSLGIPTLIVNDNHITSTRQLVSEFGFESVVNHVGECYKRHCLEKLGQAEKICQQFCGRDPVTEEGKSQVASLLLYFADNVDLVVPYIHDLWSAQLFRDGWNIGNVQDDRKREHHLLVPYLSLPDLTAEDNLAIDDLTKMSNILDPAVNTQIQKVNLEMALRNLVALSNDDQFVNTASEVIHENWRKIRKQRGFTNEQSKRVTKPFKTLNYQDKIRAIINTKTDLLAVVLATKELSNSPKGREIFSR